MDQRATIADGIRRDLPCSRNFELVLLADLEGNLFLRLLKTNLPPHPETGATKVYKTHRMAVEEEQLRFLIGGNDRVVILSELTFNVSGANCFILVDGMLECWVSQKKLAAGVWAFLCEVTGENGPVPGSIDAIWQKVKRTEPTATRVEDDNGDRMYPPPSRIPAGRGYRFRKLVPCEDGKHRMATFSGANQVEADMEYYRYIRRIRSIS